MATQQKPSVPLQTSLVTYNPDIAQSRIQELLQDATVHGHTWHTAVQSMLDEAWMLRLAVVVGFVMLLSWIGRKLMHEYNRRS